MKSSNVNVMMGNDIMVVKDNSTNWVFTNCKSRILSVVPWNCYTADMFKNIQIKHIAT